MTIRFQKVADAFKRRMERLRAQGKKGEFERLRLQMLERQGSRASEVARLGTMDRLAKSPDPSIGATKFTAAHPEGSGAVRSARAYKALPALSRAEMGASLSTYAGRMLRKKLERSNSMKQQLAKAYEARLRHQMPETRKRILDPRTNKGLLAAAEKYQKEIQAGKRRKVLTGSSEGGTSPLRRHKIDPLRKGEALPKPSRVRYVPPGSRVAETVIWRRGHGKGRLDRPGPAWTGPGQTGGRSLTSRTGGRSLMSMRGEDLRSMSGPPKPVNPRSRAELDKLRAKLTRKAPKKGVGRALFAIGGKLLRRGR